jgi:hypothetical protein
MPVEDMKGEVGLCINILGKEKDWKSLLYSFWYGRVH